jgi:hypothetical protein
MTWPPLLRRAGRRTNLALLVLLIGAFISGWVAFAVAEPIPAALVTVAHGLLGLGVVVLVPWKAVVVRRARGVRASSLVLVVAIAACLAGGFVLVFAGYVDVLGYTPIQLHVGAALVAVPLFVLHVVRHRHRQVPRRRDLNRRALLRTAGFAAAAAAGYAALEGLGRLAGSPSAQRIATGSHPLAPADVPATSWLFDRVPALDPRTHRIDVAGRSMSVAELAALAGPVAARLDCTSGWYADEVWTAVRLDRIVPAPAAGLEVVSVTGYSRLFPAAEAAQLWLAVAGEGVLRAGRGAPVRLVAPGRRGFWWVKWVAEVRLVGTSAWLQPPFPLQ